MAVDQGLTPASRTLLLIDGDAEFGRGLRACLAQYREFELLEDRDGSRTIALLERERGFAGGEVAADGPDWTAIALVILDLDSQGGAAELCQRMRGQTDVPILVVAAVPSQAQLDLARQLGANGYCAKGLPFESLVVIMRRVAGGQSYWMPLVPLTRRAETEVGDRVATPSRMQGSFWGNLRQGLRRSGLEQIDQAMAELEAALKGYDLTLLERAIAAGRYRELRAARWVVNGLWSDGASSVMPTVPPEVPVGIPSRIQNGNLPGISSVVPPRVPPRVPPAIPPSVQSLSPSQAEGAIAPVVAPSLARQQRELRSLLFDRIAMKLQMGLENQSDTSLETDILREEKKRELFYLVLRKIEDLLGELVVSQVQAVQLKQKQGAILQDLWLAIVTDFFGKYYTVTVAGVEVEVVETVLQDVALIQSAILDKMPGISDLLRHLLFQAPLEIENGLYPPGNPEALARAEAILENWMIQMANAVMQPLLNHFGNVEAIKQTFYDRRLMSIREVERFRNGLSWKYRMEKLWQEPTDIFESKHALWILTGRGIQRTSIYGIRYSELETLEGLPRVITLVLEARDAIAPRLRSVVSLVGNGVIYVLTDVIGRGLGLIGRGVLKGMGNSWREGKRK